MMYTIFYSETAKTRRNKTIVATALILLLAISMVMAGMQLVKADNVNYTTAAFVAVMPNPAQVRQTVFVSFWIQPYSPGIGALVYHNLTVTITDPTGRTETKGPYAGNPNAGGFFTFAPTMVGNYSLKFSYPGETFPTVNR